MSKEMVISANPHETRVAIMEEGLLCEYYVEREKEFALVGSIYKGRVTRVLPGMQSSFVDIGLDSDAFLYVSDFLEGIEELDDHIAEEKSSKAAEPPAFAPSGEGLSAGTGSPAPAAPPSEAALPAPSAAPVASSSTGLAPMPGEHLSRGGAEGAESGIEPGNFVAAPPPRSSAPYGNRGRHDNRGRSGGDFGRRGGRGGRGRFGRSGRGGQGGDRRFGRDLPPSKYASHRPYEPPSEENLAEGHVSVILPGESLARYKDKPPVAEAAPAGAENSTELVAPVEIHETTSDPAAVPEHREHAPEPSRAFEPRREQRPEQRSFSAGLEPLPGESLSKWKTPSPAEAGPLEPVAELSAAAPPIEEAPHETGFGASGEAEEHEVVASEESAPDLSPEEAAALAEQVAEAQEELAEREAEERSFAAADDAAGAVHDAVEGEDIREMREVAAERDELGGLAETADADSGDDELEMEEEAAEGEGMLAPSAESEADREADALAAEAAASLAEETAQPREQQPWRAQVRDDPRARLQFPRRDRGPRDRGRRDDRGRRPHHRSGPGHHHHGHPQPRRPQLIADMLKQGQEIIVQIAKEPLGKKGARITSHVALPGRFLVYMPTLDHTGVSRKIASAEERSRLRHLVNDAKGASGGGFIVRTAASSASPDEVRADVEFLTRTWSEIKAKSEQKKAPSLLHRDLNLVQRLLRDHMSGDYSAIWVDSEDEYTKVVDFMSRFQPSLVNRVKLYTKETPVFEEFGIQQEIDKGLRPKVWLKSGGYIVINHTEALVAIDVNTGKFVGKGSNRLEDTIVRTNVEAAKEIVRQMRLRDLGGIIVIDFIDMEERRNRDKVMAALEDALRADKAPSKVLRFNEFGLVAITRKRTKQALERMLSQPCPYCTGSGMVKSIPTLCYEIQTEAHKMAPELNMGSITLRVHPEIGKALKTRESSLIDELEQWTKKTVIIQADPTLHWEQYDIY